MSGHWKKVKAAVGVPATVALLSTGLAIGMAAPAAAEVTGPVTAAQDCGYYTESGEAYFNNCTTDGLIIRVGTTDGSYDTCVMPGITHLGGSPPIRSAYVVPHVPICG